MYVIKINQVKKDGGMYNIMLNHEVVEYDYEVSTHSCEHQIKDF
jgi:hypothetical protein